MRNRLECEETILAPIARKPDKPLTADSGASSTDLLELYLSDMCRHLPELSKAEVQAVLQEVREHLRASANRYEALGEAPETALQSALAAFGSPQTLGAALAATYQAHGVEPSTLLRRAMGRALAVCVKANLIAYSLVLSLTWAQINQWKVAPWNTGVIGSVLFFLLPAFVGWKIGSGENSRRAGLGTFFALTLLSSLTFLLLPLLSLATGNSGVSSLLLAMPLLYVVWMPTASLTAHLAERLTNRADRLPLVRCI